MFWSGLLLRNQVHFKVGVGIVKGTFGNQDERT